MTRSARAIAHDTQGVRRGTCRATHARSVPAVHPRHARAVSAAARDAALRDGEGARLPGLGRAAPARRPPDPPGGDGHRLSPAHDAGRRRGPGRLGRFGSIRIGRGVRPLSGFVMVLSYSRAVFALFTLDQTLESFLRGHVEAFHAWSGRRAHPGLRQSAQRRPRTRRHRDSLSSAAARARRPLSLRAAARARRGAPMRRARSSARSSTCATPSLRRAPLPTSTI